MQENSTRRSNKTRSLEMRMRLIGAARQLFVEKGFADTGTPEIVRSAQVTRGALYHHFADKTDLFRTVIKIEAAAIGNEIARETKMSQTAIAALSDGTRAYFKAMQVPGRVRLLLLDGPAILGASEIAAIESEQGGARLRDGLAKALKDTGVPVDALADILSAGYDRAAIAIADGADPAPYQTAILNVIEALVDD